jgi:prepilin-type processing-associated H-X9-DG protein
MGMLQLLAVDRTKRTVQFRYRMLQAEGGAPGIDNDAESQQLAASVRRLMHFGRSLLYYANRHDDQLPLTFEQMKDYADSEQDYQWIVANVQYLGAGITTAESGSFLLAYDRTLFEKGKGTHVLFLDCHVEFLPPDWLAKYGITRESQGNRPVPPQ